MTDLHAMLDDCSRMIDELPSKADLRKQTEALASWMMLNGYATGHGDDVAALVAELDWQHRERMEKNDKYLPAILAMERITTDCLRVAVSALEECATGRAESDADTLAVIRNVAQEALDKIQPERAADAREG